MTALLYELLLWCASVRFGGVHHTLDLWVPFLVGGVPEPSLAAVDPAPWAGTGLSTWKVFRVPVQRLDDYLAGFHDISFIKVDVEGHEGSLLVGSQRNHSPLSPGCCSSKPVDSARTRRWLSAGREKKSR